MAKSILSEEELKRRMTGDVNVFEPQVKKTLVAKEVSKATEMEQSVENKVQKAPIEQEVLQERNAIEEVTSEVMEAGAKTPPIEMDKDLPRYEKTFLTRSIVGLSRTNVGISVQTLDKVEKVVNRLFDGRIAVSTFVDNIIDEHLAKNEKIYNKWLMQKSVSLFG